LQLGVELVDLFLELCFSLGMSLGMLCLHLGKVGFHGRNVLVVGGVFNL